jgi:hypothetical protein
VFGGVNGDKVCLVCFGEDILSDNVRFSYVGTKIIRCFLRGYNNTKCTSFYAGSGFDMNCGWS